MLIEVIEKTLLAEIDLCCLIHRSGRGRS